MSKVIEQLINLLREECPRIIVSEYGLNISFVRWKSDVILYNILTSIRDSEPTIQESLTVHEVQK
jgi:hypothetical protein